MGTGLARRPRPARTIWITTAAVLALGCVGVTQLQATGVPQSDLVLGASEERTGQERLAEHFPAGSGSPVYVVAQDDMQRTADILLQEGGIAQVAISADTPSGTAPVTADGIQAAGAPGGPGAEVGGAPKSGESATTPGGSVDGASGDSLPRLPHRAGGLRWRGAAAGHARRRRRLGGGRTDRP